ncbi:MAG: porin [Proteobacteria bacterium]|nr:porin [Pseudomonadota bacterium]NOG60869.1 porin [Pseudomonadota bacterium]
MNKSILKKASLVALAGLLPVSAMADVSISGWVNEEMMYYDDGSSSDLVSASGNGVTLGSRITFSGSTELPNSGLTAGFEVILEPQGGIDGQPFLANQIGGGVGASFDDGTGILGNTVTTLGHNVNLAGSFGKVTLGLISTPTDNIGVLSDPTVGLWDAIAIPYHGIGFTLKNGAGASVGAGWGGFLQCANLGVGGGIGADCNGAYRNGIRYDLPSFNNVNIAIGYANDDIYDISAEWKGNLGGLTAALGLGYMINNNPTNILGGQLVNLAGAATVVGSTSAWQETEIFQMQAGLMDPGTGIYGWAYYQNEDADMTSAAAAATAAGQTDSDTYMFKVGIKKAFNSLGDTSISGFYGSYNDMFGAGAGSAAASGTTGSEVERVGFSVVQHFGGSFQIYGMYENYDLDVDCTAATACATAFSTAEDLDVFVLGTVFFF